MPLSGFNTLIPVTFLYEHDSNLLFNQNTFATQQGLPLNLVNALSSCKDETILNYSNIFLTDTLKVDDVIHINSKQTLPLNFATYLGLSGYPNITSNTVYVTLSADPSLSAALTFSTSLSDATHTHFMFNDIDGLRCRISVIDNSWTKNLTVNLSTFNCYFSVRTPVISAQNSDIFEYSIDNAGFLKLFQRQPNNFYIIRWVNNSLSAVDASTTIGLNGDIITTSFSGVQNLKFVNDFIYYDKNSINNFSTNKNNIIKAVPQNHVLHYNYESHLNFTTGGNVLTDYFKTKNVLSNKYFVNDRLPFNNNILQRRYTTILSKQNSEKYIGDLQFNYNYYTKEFLFIPDVATKFTLPGTLYPFNVININDSNLINAGAYGGLTPVFSDKVYKSLNYNTNIVNNNEANGTFLYSWLFTDVNQTTAYWLDRYYFPQNITLNNAFTGTNNQLFNFTSALSTYLSSYNGLSNYNYYDIKSSLTFEPSASYYYSRIGNNYINKIVNTFPLAQSNFTIYDQNDVAVTTADSISFSNNYSYFKLDSLNGNNSFTISFDLTSANLSAIQSNLIIGNNFDEGISLYKGGISNIYTPGYFITTYDRLLFFDRINTQVFELNLSAYISQPYRILDIVNIGFDHQIKLLYVTLLSSTPGFLEFSLYDKVYNKVEFPELNLNLLSNGLISKLYVGNSQVYYHFTNVNNYILQFDYINNAFTNAYISNGSSLFGSIVFYNNNIVQLAGYRGVTLGKYGVSKNNQTIYFKDLDTGNEYATFSAYQDYIYDIQVLGKELYVQTSNKITTYDMFKRPINTYISNISAVSGLKIDFINDEYETKLLSFTTDLSGRIIVDTFSLTTQELISSFNTNIFAASQYYQELNGSTNCSFFTPTNLTNINNVNSFDQYDLILRADLFSGHNYKNKTVVTQGFNINHNSHITIAFDSVNGLLNCYKDGVVAINATLSANTFFTSYLLNNNFGIGMPFISNRAASTICPYDFAANYTLDNFRVYNRYLNTDEIKFDYLSNVNIDSINFDIPCGTRNNTDTITTFNKMTIPGRKNNNIKIYIKNLTLSTTDQSTLNGIIRQKLANVLPLNIDDIKLLYTS